MNQLLASVIIPLWNGRDYIERCLSTVLAQDYSALEVIVVDNASGDNSADLVAEKFPSVRLIRNKQNLGFAGGVNVGLRAARGEVMILLNQDTFVEPGWLRALVSGLLDMPDGGIAGCKILNVGAQIIQHAGGYLTKPRALPGHVGHNEIDTGQYNQVTDADFVTGGAMAIHRRVVEAIGYFDEAFFFYFEDVDYCYRARAAGFRVVYIPSAVLYHHDKASLGAGTISYYTRFHTSRLQFALKHWGTSYFISELQPQEWMDLEYPASPQERLGLRQAYQTVFEGVGGMSKELSIETADPAKLLSLLSELRQRIYASYPADALHLPADATSLTSLNAGESLPERWWEVRDHRFVSAVPLVGPIIAGFRQLWHSISTKWSIHIVLQQQNKVNRLLVERLQTQEQLLEIQGQILRAIDHDQTRLTTQLVEATLRLKKLEALLPNLVNQKDRL